MLRFTGKHARNLETVAGLRSELGGSEGTMMKRLVVRYCACLCLLGTALSTLSLLSSPGSAQQLTQAQQPTQAQHPTQAQIDAVRHTCSGDYQTYCQTVPTGGPAALNCLIQNMPRLTARCHEAMGAMMSGGAAAGGSATPSAPPPGQH